MGAEWPSTRDAPREELERFRPGLTTPAVGGGMLDADGRLEAEAVGTRCRGGTEA